MRFRASRLLVGYFGFSRSTEVMLKAVRDERASIGGIEVVCLECLGTGVWGFMEPDEAANSCVDCKGTGKIWVSA